MSSGPGAPLPFIFLIESVISSIVMGVQPSSEVDVFWCSCSFSLIFFLSRQYWFLSLYSLVNDSFLTPA